LEGTDDIGNFGPTIPSLPGGIDAMEADLHSRGSISTVHKLEKAAYSNHGMPPPAAELPPPSTATQVSNNMMALGTALSLPIDEILSCMLPKSPAKDALFNLYLIILSKAGSLLYLFDEIVGSVAKHVRHTFQKGATLPH
jgi:hypothetical protein